MTYTIAIGEDNVAVLRVDFADEGVDLQGEIKVPGGEGKALAYLPIFEADLRRNFSYLFPVEGTEGGGEA